MAATLRDVRQEPVVLVIDFHHARGPEIELCLAEPGSNPAVENDWSLLPFMALSDGAHAATEEFSYFTLRRAETPTRPATSLFGISCTRQIAASSLIYCPPDVTRSTVQKAVVVVTDSPEHFGPLREKLSMVTSAWFAQRDFSDIEILRKFRESLVVSLRNEDTKDHSLGLSLRELIHEFKYQTLVLFKCLLLQPKMLFFGSRCERLCMMQFSLISLIPGLMNHLEDCADPSFDSYAQTVEKPSSLKTSERQSLLAYMGLPLQIFGKGSIFGPYTPLQQLDLLADHGTKSYVVGSTNSLLLQQKDKYSDVLINLDDGTITISPALRSALSLTPADRRWIDFLTQAVNETWDDSHPSQPKTHGYMGSEEFIRMQFEEYLLALLSCVNYAEQSGPATGGSAPSTDIEGDPSAEFNTEFLARWRTTPNYALFRRLTSDALLFSIVEPRHPCAGGLTIEDVQRRIAQQIADLHLDEKVRESREVLNKTLASGQKRVSEALNSFWADIEALRESQRRRSEEKQQQQKTSDDTTTDQDEKETKSSSSWFSGRRSVDLAQAQATVSSAGQKASAYFNSWSTWASERRREWAERRSASTSTPTSPGPLNSPSTSTLPSVNERPDAESAPRRSEDSISSQTGQARNSGRWQRWSSVLRGRREERTSESSDDVPRSTSTSTPAQESGREPETKEEEEEEKHDATANNTADSDTSTPAAATAADSSEKKEEEKEEGSTQVTPEEEKKSEPTITGDNKPNERHSSESGRETPTPTPR